MASPRASSRETPPTPSGGVPRPRNSTGTHRTSAPTDSAACDKQFFTMPVRRAEVDGDVARAKPGCANHRRRRRRAVLHEDDVACVRADVFRERAARAARSFGAAPPSIHSCGEDLALHVVRPLLLDHLKRNEEGEEAAGWRGRRVSSRVSPSARVRVDREGTVGMFDGCGLGRGARNHRGRRSSSCVIWVRVFRGGLERGGKLAKRPSPAVAVRTSRTGVP